jgi:hypothetical protein
MTMTDSYKARRELAAAIGKIQAAARELEKPELSDDEKFAIAWGLGHVELRDLEDFRNP